MLSCNGPTLSEWESTPHVANIPLWCFVAVTENTPLHDCMVFFRSIFETQRSWNNRSCLSNQLYCMTSSEMISRILQSSLSEFVFVVSVFCTWADQQAKAKRADISECFCHPWLITRPPTKNHKGKMCLLYELVKIGRNNSLYCFGSVFIPLSYFVNLFSSRRDFPLKSCRESSGSKSFNKSPSKSFSSARWRPPKSWPCGILISVHFWRSRQWEVDRDGAKARDWIWRGHLAGLHTISSAERFERPGKISLEKRVQNRIHERHCKTNILKRHKRCIG